MLQMRSLAIFVAGMVVGTIVMLPGMAQERENTGLRLNHVGIRVNDFQQSLDFYTKVMGFPAAFSFPPNPDGRPSTVFLQINRDTFLEMAPASADQPAGLTHIGIYTDDANASVTQLRQAGGTIADSRPSSNSGSRLANITDPSGNRLELNEQPSGSLMRTAMESWQ